MKHRTTAQLTLAATLLFSSTFAHALPSVCELAKKPLPAGVSSEQARAYKDKLSAECDLQMFNTDIRDKAAGFLITPERITLYQAMRYVQRSFYETSKQNETPIQLTYQRRRTDYKKPNSEKSSEIWDNWIAGLHQVDSLRREIVKGGGLTIEDLKRAHVGFYTLTDETGDFAHEPHPGVFKPESDQDMPWWKLKSVEEAKNALAVTAQLNSRYREMGLLSEETEIVSIRPVDGTYAVYSGSSRFNATHVRDLLVFVNRMLEQARMGTHMMWKNRLMTPGEVAYFSQQMFTQIHPFHEGNGRISRFLQEVILTAFGLPHGSSGDLMDDDVLTNHDDYYKLAIRSNLKQLGEIDRCLSFVYPELTGLPSKRVKDSDQSLIEYDCRILR